MPLLILPFIIILLSVFSLFRNNSQRALKKQQDAFWEKEQRANQTRRQDISQLDYIRIPMDAFPFGQYTDEQLASFENILKNLSSRQILNLTGISNTDLKLQYGAANLPALTECDTNYSTLLALLANYGEKLYELSHRAEAKQVLEYALSLGTDVGKNYDLLAAIYEEEGHPEQIGALRSSAENLTSIRKNSILRKLDARKEQDITT